MNGKSNWAVVATLVSAALGVWVMTSSSSGGLWIPSLLLALLALGFSLFFAAGGRRILLAAVNIIVLLCLASPLLLA